MRRDTYIEKYDTLHWLDHSSFSFSKNPAISYIIIFCIGCNEEKILLESYL